MCILENQEGCLKKLKSGTICRRFREVVSSRAELYHLLKLNTFVPCLRERLFRFLTHYLQQSTLRCILKKKGRNYISNCSDRHTKFIKNTCYSSVSSSSPSSLQHGYTLSERSAKKLQIELDLVFQYCLNSYPQFFYSSGLWVCYYICP